MKFCSSEMIEKEGTVVARGWGKGKIGSCLMDIEFPFAI